ncbi:MAG: PID-CTERM protein-sorting domain-containing protein [Bacteroidota bacterium]
MKKKIKLLLSMLVVFFLCSFAPPGEPGGEPEEDDPPVGEVSVPIDGGAIALLVGGAVYGVKKIRENKN